MSSNDTRCPLHSSGRTLPSTHVFWHWQETTKMELERITRQGQEVRDEVRAAQRNALLPASAGGVHEDSPAFELWQASHGSDSTMTLA